LVAVRLARTAGTVERECEFRFHFSDHTFYAEEEEVSN
jgi:hypothetical protein